MTVWALGLALLFGVPALLALASRAAAAIPAKSTNSAEARARPQLPGWMMRSWLPAFVAIVMTLLAGACSPTWSIFLWSLAGPWTVLEFGEGISVVMIVIVTTLLVVGVASYSIRPNLATAAISLGCGLAWFALGFGTLRMGV